MDNIGQTEDYRYDSRSNLVARADAVGPITGRTINRRGLGSTDSVSVNDFGNVTRTRYDGLSRTLEMEAILTASGVGDGTHIGATLEGVLSTTPTPDTSQSGDGLISVYYSYDDNSQLLALRDDDGNTTAYIYDNQNRTLTERKGLFVGGANFAIAGGDSGTFNVSLRGGVPPVDTEPTGTDIAYTYDRDSNVSTLTDEAGNLFACTYDALNRKKSCAITRAAGFIGTTGQTWEYDGLSRITFCFDNNEGGTADDVTSKYFYDSLSRKVEETQQIGALSAKAISSNFDIAQSSAVSQYSATVYPDGRRVDSTYDTLDRLLSHRDNGQGSNIGTYTYIGQWRALTLDYQNGTRLTHLNGTNDVGFDALRRIINHHWEVTSTSQLIVGFEHQDGFGNSRYDRANNKRMEFKTYNPDNSEQYKYDSVYRLASTGSGNQAANTRGFERGTFANASRTTMSAVNFFQDWDLEGVGNWSDFFNNSATAESRTHSDFNEIVQKGTATLTHDKNGNLTDDGVNTYEWDALNRLRKATRQSNSQLVGTYTYDCHNRRMRKVTASDTTDFYYDGWRVVEERDGGDAVTQQYVYGVYLDEVWTLDNRRGGITVAQLNDSMGNQRHFYHSNTLYHVYGLTDETGALKEGYQYDAYGRHTLVEPGGNGVFDTPDWGAIDDVFTADKPSQLGNPYTYTGQRLDVETGLMYYKNRYYGMELGRFISRDAVGYVDGMNLYEYVGSRPTNATDSSGKYLVAKDDSALLVWVDVLRSYGIKPQWFQLPSGKWYIHVDPDDPNLKNIQNDKTSSKDWRVNLLKGIKDERDVIGDKNEGILFTEDAKDELSLEEVISIYRKYYGGRGKPVARANRVNYFRMQELDLGLTERALECKLTLQIAPKAAMRIAPPPGEALRLARERQIISELQEVKRMLRALREILPLK